MEKQISLVQHPSIRRYEIFSRLTEEVGGATVRESKVEQREENVSRALWLGDTLAVILEQGRRAVGFKLFKQGENQKKEANRYMYAFLQKNEILNTGGEQ